MFSPTSGGTVTAPKETPLIEKLTALIDAALVARTKAEYAQGRGSGQGLVAKHRIGSGYIGLECARQLAYRYHKTPKEDRGDSKVSPGELQRHAESGFWLEREAARWLRDAGFELHTEKDDGTQYGYIACQDHSGQSRLAGEIDGVIVAGPEGALPYPCLWESKKATDKKYKSFLKDGVKKADPKYHGQLQTNMLYMEVHQTLFTMMDLDNMKFYFELVEFDPREAQRLQDRASRVLESRVPEDLPRISDDKADFRCRYCDFKTVCHSSKKVVLAESPGPVAPSWLLGARPAFDEFKEKNPY